MTIAENENRIQLDEPGEGESSATTSSAPASEKTAYCAKCHRRHRLAAWPEGHPRGDAEAATITGAASAKELGQQTREAIAKGKRGGGRVTATERKLTAEEEERRRKASVKLGRKVAAAPYSIAVLVTANPDWREELSEQEIQETAEDFADFCEAWGIKAAGKIASAVILSIGMATTGGKVYGRVKAKEAERDIRFPQRTPPPPVPGKDIRA